MTRRNDDPANPMRSLAPVIVCHATARSGEQCKQVVIPGGTVCRFHGGSAPQVREAARRRLEAFVPRALNALEAIALDSTLPPAARVRALVDLLDRAGLKPATELSVSQAEATNADLDAAILQALEARQQG